MKKSKIVNFFAGPGAGKSTLAAKLFVHLKENGHVTELVSEYAKDLTYGKDNFKLMDQLYVFAKQNHKIWRLQKNHIDTIVTDSPLLLSLVYYNADHGYDYDHFYNLVGSVWDSHENINIFIDRNNGIYQQYGRSQTLDEARKVDESVLNLLNSMGVPYHIVKQGDDALQQVLNILEGKL